MSSSERAFVAGATGLTGRFVVAELRRRGIDVRAHVRPDSPRLAEWRERFEGQGAVVDTTAWEPAAIARTLEAQRPTLTFALLGTTRARASRAAKAGGDPSKESYDAVDVALTEQLIAASGALASMPRFVYLSSAGAGELGRGSYLDARTRVESTLARSGLPYTIARPSFIVGDRDDRRASEKIGAPIADALLGALGVLGARRTADRYRSIRGEDLAQALVIASLDPARAGAILEADALQAMVRAAR